MIYIIIDNSIPEYQTIINDCTANHNLSTNIGVVANGIYTIVQIVDPSWLPNASWISAVTQLNNQQANEIVSSWSVG